MPWRPLNAAHAIERVRLVVQFKHPIPDKLVRQIADKVQAQQNETRLVGPTPLQALSFNMQIVDGRQHVFPGQPPVGVQFTRVDAKNQPIEVLSVAGNQISYETVEYRRWNKFQQRYVKAPGAAVDLAANVLDVEFFSLEFLDRFIFTGLAHEALPTRLLANAERFLDEDTLTGRTMWHLHRGWFQGTLHGDVLINQNFDAADVVMVGAADMVRTITVLTKADARASEYKLEAISTVELLDLLHQQTDMFFRQAMVPEMLAAVGMGEGGE